MALEMLSHILGETICVHGEDIRVLKVDRSGTIAEEKHQEVYSLRVRGKITKGHVSLRSPKSVIERADTHSQNIV